MRYTEATDYAARIHGRRHSLTLEERKEVADKLHAYGCFSISQIGKIIDTPPTTVAGWGLRRPGVRTGGRFDPATLHFLSALMESAKFGNLDVELVGKIVHYGTSPIVIARLTGVPLADVRRTIAAAKREGLT